MTKNGNILCEAIGKKIKELRKVKRLGQEDLAELISLSRSSLSNIEIGKHQPSIQTIYEIALALNCNINDILPSIESYKVSTTPIEEQFEEIFNSLPEHVSKKNLNILKEILKKDDD